MQTENCEGYENTRSHARYIFNVERTRNELRTYKHDTTDSIVFYEEHKTMLEVIHRSYTYQNNSILLDSIQTVFFLNINFKLLSIINHVKNRVLTMDESWNESVNETDPAKRKRSIEKFLLDIGFLASYYDELLGYFHFDMLYTRALSKRLGMYILDFLRLPKQEQIEILKKAARLARRDARKTRKELKRSKSKSV